MKESVPEWSKSVPVKESHVEMADIFVLIRITSLERLPIHLNPFVPGGLFCL